MNTRDVAEKDCLAPARLDLDGILALAVLIVPNIVSFVLLFPGYFQADHQTTIATIAMHRPSQWHSLTWGYLAYPFIYLSPHYSLYGLLQLLSFVACAWFGVFRIKRLGIIRRMTPLCTFYGLFPTYLLYNQLWGTDSCLAYILVLLTSLLIELTVRREEAIRDTAFDVRLMLVILFTTLLRKNAILISASLCVLLPLTFKENRLRAFSLGALPIVAAMLVNNLFFPLVLGAVPAASAGYSSTQELLSVPATQIARVYANEGEVPEEANAVLTKERSAQEWADAYIPYIADAAKRGLTLTPEFLGAWARVGMANPRIYLDAYVELMRPYWTFGKARGYRYGIGLSTDFGVWEDFTLRYSDSLREGYLSQFGQKRSKLYLWPQRSEKWVDKRLPRPLQWVFYDVLFNRGLPLWILILGGIVSARKRDYLIVAAPAICVMLSLLVFSPVAAFRYLLCCYYVLPLILLALWSWHCER